MATSKARAKRKQLFSLTHYLEVKAQKKHDKKHSREHRKAEKHEGHTH